MRRVKLDENLDMQAAGRLAAELAKPGAVELDASGVAHVGGLAAQLILSAHLSGGPGGAGLTIADPSDAFDAGLRRLGIDLEALSA